MTTTNDKVGADIRAQLDAVAASQQGKQATTGLGKQATVDNADTVAALTQASNETKFWQLKYFELQQHTSQVISALSRQTVVDAFTEQLKGLGAQQG